MQRVEVDKFCVAPYVGAWIETLEAFIFVATFKSHPTWVRGLKLVSSKVQPSTVEGRTLRGCVD